MKKTAITFDAISNFLENFNAVYEDYLAFEEDFEIKSEENNFVSGYGDDLGEFVETEFIDENKKERKNLYLDWKIDPYQLTHKYKFFDTEDFLNFLNSEFAFEIYTKCVKVKNNVDLNNIDLICHATNNAIPAILFFLSKEKFLFKTIRFMDYSEIYEYNTIITTLPKIVENKPKRKKVILIN